MSQDNSLKSVTIPALFDSDEPLFLTPAEPEASPAVQRDDSELSFDATGDIHETCTW